jgi:hypothetical protein
MLLDLEEASARVLGAGELESSQGAVVVFATGDIRDRQRSPTRPGYPAETEPVVAVVGGFSIAL